MGETRSPFHIELLRDELLRRQAKNPRYSLRAFASHLGIHPSALSRILASKQEISPKSALTAARKLQLDPERQRMFLQSIVEARKATEAEVLGRSVNAPGLRPSPRMIEAETYEKLAELSCIAVLELSQVQGFDPSPEWIAEKLGMSENQARDCLERLISTGLLIRQGGRLRKTHHHYSAIDSDRTNRARIRQQRKVLEGAMNALENEPFDMRWISGMMMAIDPSKLQGAKRLIHQFMEDLCDFLETGNQTRVYQLAIQLYPVSKDARSEKRDGIDAERLAG